MLSRLLTPVRACRCANPARSQRLLETLYSHLPQVRGKVDVYELSTPLTTRHFSNYARGELYGIDHTPWRFRRRFLRPKTPIRGLYLTGQDISSCGVAGALMGGVLSASAILGRNLLDAVTTLPQAVMASPAPQRGGNHPAMREALDCQRPEVARGL